VEIAKDRRFQDGELYALKVKGNSMIGDGIFDGDIAIIKKQEWAENGDTAVAIIDDNEATLKRYYKEKGRIRLQPANPIFEPIFRKNVEIRGIAIKIIRNLERMRV
jgi:repressor LexA